MNGELVEYDAPEWLRYSVEEALDDGQATWVPTGAFETAALARVPRFPRSIPTSDTDPGALSLAAARNERRSAQLAVASTDPLTDLRAEVTFTDGPEGSSLPPEAMDVRYVGYVPVEESHPSRNGFAPVEEISDGGVSGDRAPDLVADPLLEVETIDVPSHRAQPVWVTVEVPRDATVGTYQGDLALYADGRELSSYDLSITVHDVTVPDPAAGSFHLDVWMHPDAVAAEHDVEAWTEQHWSLLDAYFDDLADASQRAITVPIVHEPWQREWLDGTWRPQTETGFSSMVEWRYDGEWSFGFDRFDRFVRAARARGVGPSISAYSMLVFRGPQRLSYYDETGAFVVDRYEAGDEPWRRAWTAFLASFGDHLAGRGWLADTYLAFDERPAAEMDAAMAVIEDAPHDFEERIRIAGSPDVADLAADLSVHYNHFPPDTDLIADRQEHGRTTTFYIAYPIAHPRELSYSPPIETRMLPWIAAANDLDGVLRWSYNSWPNDVFEHPVFRYPQGAEYFVYPGDDGPLSSIRWELLKEGIGEYELARLADVDSDDEAFELATRDPDGRDKAPSDIAAARRALFDRLD